jgi:glyoxylase-like metal-dependent hydrolase (beta-lactamase superfamily II)
MARLMFLLALVFAAPVQAAESLPALRATGYFQMLHRVDRRVWVLAQPRFQLQPVGNVTIVEQDDGFVLVDAGGSPGSGRRIVAAIRSLGAKPVKAVILTQWHGDKVQGLSEILKVWPHARTIATGATRRHLSDPATMNSPSGPDPARNAKIVAAQSATADYLASMIAKAKTPQEQRGYALSAAMFRQYARDMDGALTLAPKESFGTQLFLSDRHVPVEALFLGRGNTDGDAVIWLPRQKILVAGELVILPFPYGYKSYPADWIATLAKLDAYPFRTLVPGHGMPQHDHRQIARIRSALEDVREQMRPLAAQKLDLAAARAQLDFDGQARIFAGGDPWLRLWFVQFWADPIAESAWRESRGEPIVQRLGG